MAATAPKDSQNPTDSTAQGSSDTTASAASPSTRDGVVWRSAATAAATTASITSVRCAGTAKPAISV